MARKSKRIGIGGIDCPCCRPPRSSKRDTKRIVAREERRDGKKAARAE